MTSIQRLTAVVLATVLSTQLLAQDRPAPHYRVVELPDLCSNCSEAQITAMDINNHNDITGFSPVRIGYQHAFLYSRGVTTDIGTLMGQYPGIETSLGLAINDAQDIVGESDLDPYNSDVHAFNWTSGNMFEVGPFSVPQLASSLVDISEAGVAVGYAFVFLFGSFEFKGLVIGPDMTAGELINCPVLGWGCMPFAVNHKGVFVGVYYPPRLGAITRPSTNTLSFMRTTNGTDVFIDPIAGHDYNRPNDVSNTTNPWIVGESYSLNNATNDTIPQRAYVWQENTGTQHLDTLSRTSENSAVAINRWGEIVGSDDQLNGARPQATWYSAVSRDAFRLEDFVTNPNYELWSATGINDHGVITVRARDMTGPAYPHTSVMLIPDPYVRVIELQPGVAGIINQAMLSGLTPNGSATVYIGSALGSSSVTHPSCGTVAVGLASVSQQLTIVADDVGLSDSGFLVNNAWSGQVLRSQVIDDQTCELSLVHEQQF